MGGQRPPKPPGLSEHSPHALDPSLRALDASCDPDDDPASFPTQEARVLTRPRLCLLLPALALAACSGSSAAPSGGTPDAGPPDAGPPDAGPPPPQGAQISMSFARSSSLYDAPFPSDDLRKSDGTIDVSKVPNPHAIGLIDEALALIARDARGFALAGAVYFRASAALDPATLPDMKASVSSGASVFLVGVDPKQPDYRQRHPVDVAFLADGGPFGDKNLLAALPLQGVPLRPKARYAAVVTRAVHDAEHRPLAPSPEMAALAAGQHPDGLSDAVLAEYTGALKALAPLVPPSEVAALAVFTTDDPTAGVGLVRDDALASHPVSAPLSTPTLSDVFPTFCVFNTTVNVPDYQSGTPPYDTTGGDWRFDASGKPVFDHMETARVVITVPRSPMPASGWPTTVFVRTGGGGDRPLVDRGPCDTPLYTMAEVPGTGPALHFAAAGFAGVEIDGPLGGMRNTTMGNEDFLIFNINNPSALRDNVRESAMELTVLAHALPSISFDVSACPGASPSTAQFDAGRLAIMGHSMGAWVAPLVLSWEPAYGAGVLSGAGGSYIANVMDKLMPLAVRPVLQVVLGYTSLGLTLEKHDPVLTLIQWAAEPSDPQVYDRRIVSEPPKGASPQQILMLQGIVDHYILPSIANATSLAMGLDEAGPAYDATSPEEKMLNQTPLGSLLSYAGRSAITLPASGNVASSGGTHTTAVVVQHPGDAIEDGHEVVFQTDPPKHQYRCFLAGFAAGKAPKVPADGAATDPCP